MGKPTGFIDYLRELPLDRSALERHPRHWNRISPAPGRQEAPGTGGALHGLRNPLLPHRHAAERDGVRHCPINNLIPEWNDSSSIAGCGMRRWNAFIRRIIFRNSPGASARAPCEGSAACWASNAPPVTIKNIECSIIDHGWGARLGAGRNRPTLGPGRRWPSSGLVRLACAPRRN